MDANRRKLLIVVGVGFIAAVVCTFLFYRMLSGRLVDEAATVQAERTITVASRELPRGTRLRPEDLRTQLYQGAELPDGAFADPVMIAGSVLTAGVDQGEAIYATGLADKGNDWLASEIPEGMRRGRQPFYRPRDPSDQNPPPEHRGHRYRPGTQRGWPT